MSPAANLFHVYEGSRGRCLILLTADLFNAAHQSAWIYSSAVACIAHFWVFNPIAELAQGCSSPWCHCPSVVCYCPAVRGCISTTELVLGVQALYFTVLHLRANLLLDQTNSCHCFSMVVVFSGLYCQDKGLEKLGLAQSTNTRPGRWCLVAVELLGNSITITERYLGGTRNTFWHCFWYLQVI